MGFTVHINVNFQKSDSCKICTRLHIHRGILTDFYVTADCVIFFSFFPPSGLLKRKHTGNRGTVVLVEHQTSDWKGMSLIPGRSSERNFCLESTFYADFFFFFLILLSVPLLCHFSSIQK